MTRGGLFEGPVRSHRAHAVLGGPFVRHRCSGCRGRRDFNPSCSVTLLIWCISDSDLAYTHHPSRVTSKPPPLHPPPTPTPKPAHAHAHAHPHARTHAPTRMSSGQPMTARAGGAGQRRDSGDELLTVHLELDAFHSARVERCTAEDSSCGWVS